MVRVLVDRIIDELAKILAELPDRPQADDTADEQIKNELEDESFKDELASRLDAILGGK